MKNFSGRLLRPFPHWEGNMSELKRNNGVRYTDKQKNDALQSYIVFGGNVALTATAAKVSEMTLRNWKNTEWWKDGIAELKAQDRMELSARLKRVVQKSWDVVEDRIAHGDFILNNKTGEIVRKPVSMKEAARVAVDSVVVREKLERSEAYTVHADQVEDKLAKLAKAFSDLAKGVKPKEEPETIEFVERIDDALDDQREERLQEGESAVQQQTGTEEAS